MFKKRKKYQELDIILLILFPILATVLTMVYKPSLFTSTLLYFGAPAVYLMLRNPAIAFKSIFVAFCFSIPMSLFADILAIFDKSWIVVHSIFPFKIFGVATMEVYFFGFFYSLVTILLYEHFFDKGKKKDGISPNAKYFFYLFGALIIIVLSLLFINPELLRVPFFYFWFGVIFVVPPLLGCLYFYPKFLQRYLWMASIFFIPLLLFEISALEANQWIFPGEHFVGFVSLFKYNFPIEEFVFWIMFATPTFLSYYELFFDDKK